MKAASTTSCPPAPLKGQGPHPDALLHCATWPRRSTCDPHPALPRAAIAVRWASEGPLAAAGTAPHNHGNGLVLSEAEACQRGAGASELTQRETSVGKEGRCHQLLGSDPENASGSRGFSPRVGREWQLVDRWRSTHIQLWLFSTVVLGLGSRL